MSHEVLILTGRVAAAVLLAGCIVGGGVAQACSIDGKPSVSADGRLARINPVTPTTEAQLQQWAIFTFTRDYRVRQAITFAENRRELTKTLIPAAMRRPWRWRFGDGHTAYGWTVRHAYARPGHWRIEVDAYLPSTRQWYNFDQVVVTIVR